MPIIFHVCPPRYEPVKSPFRKALKPGTVYYARVDTPRGPLYKIGFTITGFDRRYEPYERKNMKLLALWPHQYEIFARAQEQEILEKYSEFKYCGPAVLKSGVADSELFICDVLGLDYKKCAP